MEMSTHFCAIHFLVFSIDPLWTACSGWGRPYYWYSARLGQCSCLETIKEADARSCLLGFYNLRCM